MTYRPLPEGLRIGDSEIEGQGLLSDVIIEAHTNLGLTHYKLKSGAWLRTPLGGFINHSEKPNCELMNIAKEKYLITKKDIMPNEELTLKYTMYEVENNAKV